MTNEQIRLFFYTIERSQFQDYGNQKKPVPNKPIKC